MSKATFVNKYKDTGFDLPNADNHAFYVGKNEIAWVGRRDGGCTIFRVYDVERIEDEKLTPFVTFSLIWLKLQREWVIVEMHEPGRDKEKVWGSDNYDITNMM